MCQGSLSTMMITGWNHDTPHLSPFVQCILHFANHCSQLMLLGVNLNAKFDSIGSYHHKTEYWYSTGIELLLIFIIININQIKAQCQHGTMILQTVADHMGSLSQNQLSVSMSFKFQEKKFFNSEKPALSFSQGFHRAPTPYSNWWC